MQLRSRNRFLMPLFALLFTLCLGSVLPLSAQAAFAQGGHAAAAAAIGAQDEAAGDESPYAEIVGIELDKTAAKVKNDGTVRFHATLVADDPSKPFADETVTWSIKGKKTASITQDGLVQGKRAGTATVTAKTANGLKAKATVEVVIKKKDMARAIPVLTYHRIASDEAKSAFYRYDSLAVSASTFNRQMKYLKRNGYRTISTAEFADWRLNGTFLPKKSVLVTIDDGFYETYHVAYPILKKYGLKATSFVIGSKAKKKTRKYDPSVSHNRYLGRDVIKKVRKNYPNLEFQSHTYNMHRRGWDGNGVARTWSREAIEADFAKNAKFGFTSLAYPYGHTGATMNAVMRADKSMKIGFGYIMWNPATRTSPRYNIPRFKVMGNGTMGDFQGILSTAR